MTMPRPGRRGCNRCGTASSVRSSRASSRPTSPCPFAPARGGTTRAPSRASSTPSMPGCRVTDPAVRPVVAPDETPPGEQVLLDGNVEAGDSEFFSVGALSVSPDHSRLAFAIDTSGDERFDLVVRDLSTGDTLDDVLTGIGYGVEFSLDGGTLFYTRVDEAWRPHQLWRHTVGADVSTDVLVHEEADERFWMGVGSSRDDRWLMLGLGSKTTSEVRPARLDDARGGVPGRGAPARRRRVRRRAGSRPAPHRPQHRQPRLRPRVGAARCHEPRAVAAAACRRRRASGSWASTRSTTSRCCPCAVRG